MIRERLREVESAIEQSRARCVAPIDDGSVTLVAVTKNHDVAAMREAIDAGAVHVGENRVQEAKTKFAALQRNVTWHLIGHLQTNKAKDAVKLFDIIHSVDSVRLARAVDKAAADIEKTQDILVQVNLAKESTKSGAYEEDLPALLAEINALSHLRLCGFMLIAPDYDDKEKCRPLFRRMREIFERARETEKFGAWIKYLSMGMTHDYTTAVEEGANIVRVGTGIFGARNYDKETQP